MSKIHPEDALYAAGAKDAYYEIVGAGYYPAIGSEPATATIDLSTPDHTGCLITHCYDSGETILKWDSDFGSGSHGDAEDILVAIGDLTGTSITAVAFFEAFREAITASVSEP